MGKRKRGPDNTNDPIPSDSTAQITPVDLQPEQRSLEQAESSGAQSLPPVVDVMDRQPFHQSSLNPSRFFGKSKLLKHARYPFGRHYSRRGSSNHSDASTSYWKGSAPDDDAKLSFKFEDKGFLDFPYAGITYQKPERIRLSSTQNAVSGDTRKLECRLCQKRLKKSVIISGSSLSSHDLSVVAVLVCGHAYHADCLERKTSPENRQDPSCPLCLGQIS